MRTDSNGNPITVDSEATARATADFTGGFLAHETRAAGILAAAAADPACMIANAYAGVLELLAETPDAPARALPWLEKARAAARGVTRREEITLAMAEAWAAGDILRAIAIGRQGVEEFPRDLALVKLTQYHQFNMGDAPAMLATARAAEDANRDGPHIHALLAFGLEQCHLLREAEKAAWRAIEIKRKEPWAHHALAHIHLTEGRIAEGRAFLEDVADTWTGLNSFMLTHNWWHHALFAISQGDFSNALESYDTRCWGVEKDYSQDQIGAVSLLARLELAGVDVGDRWEDVADHLAGRTEDFVNGFLSLHYLYGLARAGRPQAGEMMAGFRRMAAEAPMSERAAWAEVALPAAEGLFAHARGDFAGCIGRLGPVLGRLWETGGSHAQRDLFDQIHLDALIRAGRLVAAQQALETRRGYEPMSVPTNRALGRIYRDLGLEREAAAAEARAMAALAA